MQANEMTAGKPHGELFVSPYATLVVLLITTAILLLGSGLFGTLLGVRATLEEFNTSIIGLIVSAYFAGFMAGTFLCVRIVRQVGHVRAFAAFAALFAVSAIAHSIWVTPLAWLVFRFLAGVAAVGLALIIESWLNAQAQPENRGRIFSIYMVVNLSAVAFGQLLLMVADPATFVLFSVAAMLFAASLIPTALVRVQAPPPQEASSLGLRKLLRASPVGVAGCFAVGIVGGAFGGMAPVFVLQTGFNQDQVAVFMFLAIIGGMLSQFPIGRYSDGRDRRKVITVVATMAAVSAFAVSVASISTFTLLAAAALAFGALKFPLYGLSVARAHDVLRPEQALEATHGLMLAFGVGATAGPVMAGIVMNIGGPHTLFVWFGAILVLLGLFSFYRSRVGEEVPPEDQSHFMMQYATSHEVLEMAEDAYQEHVVEGDKTEKDANAPSSQP